MSLGITHGLSVGTYPKGLLNSSSSSKFTNHGMTAASVQGTSPVHMRANFGSVYLQGKNWDFNSNPIYASAMDITDSQDFHASDILTIVGSYKQQEYELEFIKHFHKKHEHLRIISIKPIIPEPSLYGTITAAVVGLVALMRRR